MKAEVGFALAALALAVGAVPATSQELAAQQAIRFLDRDADGKCSLNEFLTYQVTRIAQFDVNGDGVLQYGEFKDTLEGRAKRNAQRIYNGLNTEEDHSALTQREFLGYQAHIFKTYVDADGDGFMSAAEWSKLKGDN